MEFMGNTATKQKPETSTKLTAAQFSKLSQIKVGAISASTEFNRDTPIWRELWGISRRVTEILENSNR